ncbi:hypothetical protein HDV06_002532, partial [Boothiomyces sp. JEL0866]
IDTNTSIYIQELFYGYAQALMGYKQQIICMIPHQQPKVDFAKIAIIMFIKICLVTMYALALPLKITDVSAGGDVLLPQNSQVSNVESGGEIIFGNNVPVVSGRGNNQSGNGNGNTGVGNGVTLPPTSINVKGQNGQDGHDGIDGANGQDSGIVIGSNSSAGVGDNVVIGNGSNGGVSGNHAA